MLGKLNICKAQSSAEYAVLFSLVIAALITTQTYVKRGWQARVKVEADQMVVDTTTNPYWNDVSSTVVTSSAHYEPAELTRETHEITKKDTETSKIITGGITEKSFERTTAQQAEDFQKYDY